MMTKIIAVAAALTFALTSLAFAGPYLDKDCPNILAGGGTYTTADVQRCH